jgi:hypothetical protein
LRIRIISFVLLLLLTSIGFTLAASWSEVAQFSDLGDYTSDYFICSHLVWRINWNYTPSASNPTNAALLVTVYQQGVNVSVSSTGNSGNVTTNGTKYVLQQGTFYLTIQIANLEHYTVVVEQDLQSVPEFPSIILLSLLTTGLAVAMILVRRHREKSKMVIG